MLVTDVVIVVVGDTVSELVAVVDVVADVVAELVAVLVGVVDVVTDVVAVVDGVVVWHKSTEPSCTPEIAVLSDPTAPSLQLCTSATPGTISTPLRMHPMWASPWAYTVGSRPCSSELSAPTTVGHSSALVAASNTRASTVTHPIAGCTSDASHSATASFSSRAWATHRSVANCSPSAPIANPMYPSPPATSHSMLASASVVVADVVPVVVLDDVPDDVGVVDVVGDVVADDVADVVIDVVGVVDCEDVGDVEVVGDVVGVDVSVDVGLEVGLDVGLEVGVVDVVGLVVAVDVADDVMDDVAVLVPDVDGDVDVVWLVVIVDEAREVSSFTI